MKKKNVENTILDKEELREKYGEVKVGAVIKTNELMETIAGKELKGAVYIPHEKRYVWTGSVAKSIASHVGDQLEYIPRYEAEVSKTYLQPIAYCLLTSGDKVFCTRRIGGDARLKGMRSIGIGGHIDEGESIMASLHRELEEELVIDPQKDILAMSRIGYIYNNATLISSVHLGIVHRVMIYLSSCDKVSIKETDKMSGEWIDRSALVDGTIPTEEFESWSQVLIEQIKKGQIKV